MLVGNKWNSGEPQHLREIEEQRESRMENEEIKGVESKSFIDARRSIIRDIPKGKNVFLYMNLVLNFQVKLMELKFL